MKNKQDNSKKKDIPVHGCCFREQKRGIGLGLEKEIWETSVWHIMLI